jgi:integrase
MSQLTLQDVLAEYLPTADIADNTRDILRYAWKRLTDSVGNPLISEFDFSAAQKFKMDLREAEYGPTTINMWIKAVRPVTRYAHMKGYVDFDAWENVKLCRVPQDEIRVFTDQEIRDLLAMAPDARRRFIVMLGLSSLRIGECLNLLRENIDTDKHQIHICQHEASELTWPWRCKDIDSRIIPLQPQVENYYICRILPSLPLSQPYVCLQPRLYLHLLGKYRQGKLKGRQLTCPELGYAKWVKQMFAKVGIDGHFHNFRDTALTHWLNTMMPAKVQRLAGHSDINTTMRYYYGPDMEKIASEARRNGLID